MLGIRPYLGRLILPDEGKVAGADPVVVLSYRYWKARFQGDPGVINKAAFINGFPSRFAQRCSCSPTLPET
jgi:putative ABC transport system permease protein